MKNFNTSLLREKFTIYDLDRSGAKTPLVAVSNRIECRFVHEASGEEELFFVRGQNMHSCIRMVARMCRSYSVGGFLMKRIKRYDWYDCLDAILNDYERKYNPSLWVAVYHRGKVVFEYGDRHPFVDVIERMDFEQSNGDYKASLGLAEKAFQKTGKNVRIDYDGNVAYNFVAEPGALRNGIVLRDSAKTHTFSYHVTALKGKGLPTIPQCLSVAAAFLEGIQLSYLIGTNKTKINKGIIDKLSDEHKQMREARQRLERLSIEITNLGDTSKVLYRPERPSFKQLISSAENHAEDILE